MSLRPSLPLRPPILHSPLLPAPLWSPNVFAASMIPPDNPRHLEVTVGGIITSGAKVAYEALSATPAPPRVALTTRAASVATRRPPSCHRKQLRPASGGSSGSSASPSGPSCQGMNYLRSPDCPAILHTPSWGDYSAGFYSNDPNSIFPGFS